MTKQTEKALIQDQWKAVRKKLDAYYGRQSLMKHTHTQTNTQTNTQTQTNKQTNWNKLNFKSKIRTLLIVLTFPFGIYSLIGSFRATSLHYTLFMLRRISSLTTCWCSISGGVYFFSQTVKGLSSPQLIKVIGSQSHLKTAEKRGYTRLRIIFNTF